MNSDIQAYDRTSEQSKAESGPKGMQKVFRIVCIVLFLILIFCVPGFLKFRHYCQLKNYYVFSVDSFKWCTFGFFLVFVTHYLYRLPNILTFIFVGNQLRAFLTLTTMPRLKKKNCSLC